MNIAELEGDSPHPGWARNGNVRPDQRGALRDTILQSINSRQNPRQAIRNALLESRKPGQTPREALREALGQSGGLQQNQQGQRANLRDAILQSGNAGENNPLGRRLARFKQFQEAKPRFQDNSPTPNNGQQQARRVESLVIFPPTSFVSPIESVVEPGFKVYAFAGKVSTLLQSTEPVEWLSDKVVADLSVLHAFVQNFVHLTHQNCPATVNQKSSALMYIMVYKPGAALHLTGEGWHRDQSPWPSEDHIPTRYAITLLGDGTKIMDSANGGSNPKLAKRMPRLFAAEKTMEMGQIVRFTMGQLDSPMHAAPEIVKDRVFMNIVYGSETEVKSRCRLEDEH